MARCCEQSIESYVPEKSDDFLNSSGESNQGYTDLGCQVAMSTEFVTVAPNICGSSACVRHINPLLPLINSLAPNDIYMCVCVCVCMSYRTANLKTLHFKYFINKYTY